MLVPETEIIISRDGAELRRATVRPGDYVIGCHAEAAIMVDAEGVAERHAQLTVNYHELFIEDLGSDSGTFVGGKRVTESTRIWPSQKVQIGSVVLEARKVKSASETDVSLAPDAATVRRVLPEEFLRARKYEIGGLIAQGGMGAILDAHEATTQRTVAMKVMLASMSEGDVLRFIEEAQITSQLEHPNIVPVHELGVDEHDQVFYTMKLVQGVTLRQVLEKLRARDAATVAAYPLRRLLIVLMRVCDAMAFAHSRGVIHRDLKPDNVMIGDFGEVLVMDWGLAKVLGRQRAVATSAGGVEAAAPSSATLSGSVRSVRTGEGAEFTMAGAIVGTPIYMSPEQARGEVETLDESCDIWALGAILRHILTLEKPVPGETGDEVLANLRAGRLTRIPLRAAHCPGGRVPEALIAVTAKAQALSREDRYASVAQFRDEIDAWLGGFATKAQQASPAKQLLLLIQRHKGISSTAAAAWLLITVLGLWFVFNLRAKEQRAVAGEQKAVIEAGRAVAQEEKTRRTLGLAQVAVAEAAFRSGDRAAMEQALDSVPDDLRDQHWDYLSIKRDMSLGPLKDLDMPNVRAVAAVPGKPAQFAIADAKGNVALVDVRTGKKLVSMSTGYSGDPLFGLSPDGSRLAVTVKGGADIRVFRTSDGQRQQTVPAPSKNIATLLFAPDGNLLLTGEPSAVPDAKLSVVDLRAGAVRWQIALPIHVALFSPDGSRIFIGSRGRSRKFRIVDAATGKLLVDRDSYAYSIAMSVDGKLLALGLHSGEVAILDVATSTELRRARLHQGEVTQMAWTKGGHLLTLGSEGGSEEGASKGRRVMRLWETKTFALRGTFFGLRQGAGLLGWDFQPASGYLLTSESSPQLWRIPADVEAARIVCTSEQGWSVAFLSDTLLFGRRDYRLAPYEVSDPHHPRELPTPAANSDIMCAVSQPAGLVATGVRINEGGAIKLYSFEGRTLTAKHELAMPGWILRLDFDAKGERLLALSNGRNTQTFDAKGDRMLTLPGDARNTQIFATGSGESLLKLPIKMERAVFAGTAGNFIGLVSKQSANGETADELTIFDAKTGKPLKATVHRLRQNELVVSPDRRLIAIAGEEQVVRVLDADTLKERWKFRAHDDDISAMAFHPSLPILATAANDGTVKLWDYESAHLRQTFLGIDGAPVMLAFSPNGRLLALEAQEHVVRLFDLSAGAAALPGPPAPMPLPESRPDADGWADLLTPLTPALVEQTGHGWKLQNGELFSPGKSLATLRLSGNRTNTSYRLRVKLRQLSGKDVFHIALPVGDRMTGFELDGFLGNYTGLNQVNGQFGKTLPGVVKGPQVNDSEPHDLEVTVRLDGANATITATLDAQPLYEWTGPIAALSQSSTWLTTTESEFLAFATVAAGWAVSEVKLKRLEK